MKRLGPLALLLALTAPSAAYADDVMVPAFRDFCLATHGDRIQALALAKAAGWMPIPKAIAAEQASEGFSMQQGLLRTTEGDMFVLMLAHGEKSPLGVPTEICAIYASGDPVSGLNEAAAAMSEVDGQIEGSRHFFAWHEVGGKRIHVDFKSSEAKDLAKRRDINVILVSADGNKTMVGLIRP